eukprot:Tbor_TRINITY_DN1777_c0_g1::TRINITY_DN1777_c0_g1_i1::g.21280::m.21280
MMYSQRPGHDDRAQININLRSGQEQFLDNNNYNPNAQFVGNNNNYNPHNAQFVDNNNNYNPHNAQFVHQGPIELQQSVHRQVSPKHSIHGPPNPIRIAREG